MRPRPRPVVPQWHPHRRQISGMPQPLKGSGTYWGNEFSFCAIPARGGRYEDTCVDRCAAFGSVSRSGANVTHTTASRRRRQTNNSPLTDTCVICLQEIGCDVLQRGQQPQQLRLRIKYGLQIEHWIWIERRVRRVGGLTSTTGVPPCGAFPPANELCN